jgi:hypothetical protein
MRFGLVPMQQVIAGMRRRGVEMADVRALEVFGSLGQQTAVHYAPLVKSLEIWDIDPGVLEPLRNSFPQAEIRIVDSYEEIRRTNRRFELVVVDNFATVDEHFRLFPHVFRVLADEAVLVLQTLPEARRLTRRVYPALFEPEHVRLRQIFYDTPTPESIPRDVLVARYGRLAEAEGFVVEWHFFVRRREIVRLFPRRLDFYFLTLKLRRAGAPVESGPREGPEPREHFSEESRPF